MPSVERTIPRYASRLGACLLLSALLFVPPNSVRADELTGMPYDDPKELAPAPTSATPSGPTDSSMFQPMPAWSHGAMPPLPNELKPMGGKTVIASAPTTATKPPLAPPKEEAKPVPVTVVETTAQSKPTPAPAESAPAFVAVSPFLQWIKTNPQAAAAQARQEANAYQPPPAPNPAAPVATHGAVNGTGPNDSNGDPYWLPPLIDSPDIVPVVTGSAAIYSTPQR